jgi:hypothetical protein
MREQLEQALLSGAETGIVSLQITESQLTAFMADKIAQQANPPFTDPQILAAQRSNAHVRQDHARMVHRQHAHHHERRRG